MWLRLEKQALGKVWFLEKTAFMWRYNRRLARFLAWGFLVSLSLQRPGSISGKMETGERSSAGSHWQ